MVQREIGTNGKMFQVNKKPTAAESEVPRKQTRLVQVFDRNVSWPTQLMML